MKEKANKTDIIALRSDNKRLRRRVNKLLDKLSEAEADLDEACDEGVPREVHDKIVAGRDEMIVQLQNIAKANEQERAHQRERADILEASNRHLEEEIEADLQLRSECDALRARVEARSRTLLGQHGARARRGQRSARGSGEGPRGSRASAHRVGAERGRPLP